MIYYLKFLIPFAVESIGDNYLIRKGKKDIPLSVRVGLVIACSIVDISWQGFTVSFAEVALCTAPFAWFDPVLNKLRGKRLDYQGQTKDWDVKWLSRIHRDWLMVLRAMFMAGCVGVYFWLR